MKILITGASGLIGKQLVLELLGAGHSVSALVRNPRSVSYLPKSNVFSWTHDEAPAEESVRGYDAIIHLAGESVAGSRWTANRKKQVFASRVVGTANLIKAIDGLPSADRPKILVCASAIGYYGARGDEEIFENSASSRGFLAELCVAWEREADRAAQLGVRVVNLRLGVVLSREGGALSKMGPLTFGAGRQWMSWIHIDDVTGFIRHALKSESVSGPFNLTSPHPVRQKDFALTLKRVRNYPFVLRVPALMLFAALGEMSGILLDSQRVLPLRTLETGYKYLFPRLPEALTDLFNGRDLLDESFSARQFVPLPREKVVPFFSKAENLEELTPPWLNFRILKKSSSEIGKGSVIDYRLVIHGVPVKWRTLISDWSPPDSFTDEQLKGPYRKWHHVHRFYEVDGGTLLTDHVTYRVPFSWLGRIFLSRWIAADVRAIFGFRMEKIFELERTGKFS